jgi:hypothetical protein
MQFENGVYIKKQANKNIFGNKHLLVPFKILEKCRMFRHFFNIFPVLVMWKSHYVENSTRKCNK